MFNNKHICRSCQALKDAINDHLIAANSLKNILLSMAK
jgi:hypothetical protein